jgi:hypothetical protein
MLLNRIPRAALVSGVSLGSLSVENCENTLIRSPLSDSALTNESDVTAPGTREHILMANDGAIADVLRLNRRDNECNVL